MVQGASFITLVYFLQVSFSFWQLHNGVELVAVNGNPEGSAYGSRIRLGNGQPQAASTCGAGFVAPGEPLQNLIRLKIHLIGGGIHHADKVAVLSFLDLQIDSGTRQGILDGIAQEVRKNLVHSGPVGDNRDGIRSVAAPHGQSGACELVIEQADGLFQQTDKVDLVLPALQHAAGNLGQFKQGLHKIIHIASLLLEPSKLLLPLGGQGFILQKLAIT